MNREHSHLTIADLQLSCCAPGAQQNRWVGPTPRFPESRGSPQQNQSYTHKCGYMGGHAGYVSTSRHHFGGRQSFIHTILHVDMETIGAPPLTTVVLCAVRTPNRIMPALSPTSAQRMPSCLELHVAATCACQEPWLTCCSSMMNAMRGIDGHAVRSVVVCNEAKGPQWRPDLHMRFTTAEFESN